MNSIPEIRTKNYREHIIKLGKNVHTISTVNGCIVSSSAPISFDKISATSGIAIADIGNELLKNRHGETQKDRDENLLAYQGSKVMNLCLSGVYFLFCDKEIVYIGESKNPNARIGCHVKDKVFDGYRILPTNRRKYWEKVLIKRYEPKYNAHKFKTHWTMQ
jgi:predicted GIY-YIG superfamily endonuclease